MSWMISMNVVGALLAGVALVVVLLRFEPPPERATALPLADEGRVGLEVSETPDGAALVVSDGDYEARVGVGGGEGAVVSVISPAGRVDVSADALGARLEVRRGGSLTEVAAHPEGTSFTVRGEGGALVLEAWSEQAPTVSFVSPDGVVRRRLTGGDDG